MKLELTEEMKNTLISIQVHCNTTPNCEGCSLFIGECILSPNDNGNNIMPFHWQVDKLR